MSMKRGFGNTVPQLHLETDSKPIDSYPFGKCNILLPIGVLSVSLVWLGH